MKVYHKSFTVISDKFKPVFHDVTEKAQEIVSESGVKNGIAVVYSQHTTCSVIIQEDSYDTTLDGTKYLFQDLIDVFEKIIPRCRREGDYLQPGPKLLKHAVEDLGEKPEWSLNTDAHLRSCIIGRSEAIPILNGKLELGKFGRIYFGDFDCVRKRERIVHVMIIGE